VIGFYNIFTCTNLASTVIYRGVPSKRAKKIDPSKLKQWALLREFAERLDAASADGRAEGLRREPTFADPRRRLSENHYLSLLLFTFLNPVVESMRGLCAASQLRRVQRETGGAAVSLGSFSEVQHAIDPELLKRVFMDLVREEVDSEPVMRDPALLKYRRTLQVVDGTLWEALPRMGWAVWRTQHKTQTAVKMELKFNLLDDRPVDLRVGPGRSCERALLREQLREGEIYVGDRYYGKDYGLLDQLVRTACSFIIRLHDSAVRLTQKQFPLSAEDRRAGVIEDCLVQLGHDSKRVYRVVTVVIPGGEEIVLVTDKMPEELSAALIATIYRYRWQIELFFKWLKSILGCRHWLAESPHGVTIQIYTALIAALLLARHLGRRPNRRQMELLRFYFMGYVEADELEYLFSRYDPGERRRKTT
jgi:hypothetical protein